MTGVRSSKAPAVLLVLGGGLLAVLAGSRTWLTAVPQAGAGVTSVAISGREAAPGGIALGLVAAAGAVVLATSGRVVRHVVAVVLVAAGAGIAASGLWLGVDRAALVADALARATGATGNRLVLSSEPTAWPVVGVAAGVLVLAGAVVAGVRARRWSGPSRRFEAPAATAAVVTAAAATAPEVPAAPGAGADAIRERDRALDAWDALSAGADPTDDPPRG